MLLKFSALQQSSVLCSHLVWDDSLNRVFGKPWLLENTAFHWEAFSFLGASQYSFGARWREEAPSHGCLPPISLGKPPPPVPLPLVLVWVTFLLPVPLYLSHTWTVRLRNKHSQVTGPDAALGTMWLQSHLQLWERQLHTGTKSESTTLAYWQVLAPNLYLLCGSFESKLSPTLIYIKHHIVRSGPSLQSVTLLRSLFPAWCYLYIG